MLLSHPIEIKDSKNHRLLHFTHKFAVHLAHYKTGRATDSDKRSKLATSARVPQPARTTVYSTERANQKYRAAGKLPITGANASVTVCPIYKTNHPPTYLSKAISTHRERDGWTIAVDSLASQTLSGEERESGEFPQRRPVFTCWNR